MVQFAAPTTQSAEKPLGASPRNPFRSNGKIMAIWLDAAAAHADTWVRYQKSAFRMAGTAMENGQKILRSHVQNMLSWLDSLAGAAAVCRRRLAALDRSPNPKEAEHAHQEK